MTTADTPYLETEALVAVMNGDIDHAEELLSNFLARELLTFDRQLTLLKDLVARAIRAKAIRRPESREGATP